MEKGYLSMILHAHLPYIRHPQHENFLEEHWLYEAMNETYIPLIDVFDRLYYEGIDFKITFTLTPTLLSMLADELLLSRFENYLKLRIELAEKEVERTKDIYQVSEVSAMYLEKFKRNLDIFQNRYHRDLISAFRKYYEMGKLEIVACGATHGFFPLMDITPEAIYAQVKVGIDIHKQYLGKPPKGIWLPECGYALGVDAILKDLDIQYFIMENHGIQYADPKPVYGVYAPLCTYNGVAAFGRDMESSKQVWSANEGYPGDYDYRDFYRDIGYELDWEYLKPYLLPDGQRIHTGLKYYKITGKTQDKHIYIPEAAEEKAAVHAGNFMFNREYQIRYLADKMDKPPLIVCPYDAELFGHWWYEGPVWLYYLMKKIYYNQNTFKLITPADYLEKYPIMQMAQPCPSSWGYQGYNDVWLNERNDWIYRHLHEMTKRMIWMANTYWNPDCIQQRALNQAARELLLAQSSDWAFIMKTGTMVEYAHYRTKLHVYRFNTLYEQIIHNIIDEIWLSQVEEMDNLFPDIHYGIYRSLSSHRSDAVLHERISI